MLWFTDTIELNTYKYILIQCNTLTYLQVHASPTSQFTFTHSHIPSHLSTLMEKSELFYTFEHIHHQHIYISVALLYALKHTHIRPRVPGDNARHFSAGKLFSICTSHFVSRIGRQPYIIIIHVHSRTVGGLLANNRTVLSSIELFSLTLELFCHQENCFVNNRTGFAINRTGFANNRTGLANIRTVLSQRELLCHHENWFCHQ